VRSCGLDADKPQAAKFDALAAVPRACFNVRKRSDGLRGFGAADVRRGDDGNLRCPTNHAISRASEAVLEGAAQVVKELGVNLN